MNETPKTHWHDAFRLDVETAFWNAWLDEPFMHRGTIWRWAATGRRPSHVSSGFELQLEEFCHRESKSVELAKWARWVVDQQALLAASLLCPNRVVATDDRSGHVKLAIFPGKGGVAPIVVGGSPAPELSVCKMSESSSAAVAGLDLSAEVVSRDDILVIDMLGVPSVAELDDLFGGIEERFESHRTLLISPRLRKPVAQLLEHEYFSRGGEDGDGFKKMRRSRLYGRSFDYILNPHA